MSRAHKKSRLIEWLFSENWSIDRNLKVSAVVSGVLTPRERWVLNLYDIGGISLSVAARQCGVSREILARAHRAACRKLDREYDFVTNPRRGMPAIWKRYLPGGKPWDGRKWRSLLSSSG